MKKIIAISIAAVLALGLVLTGCGAKKEADAAAKTIVVGASSTPHAEILEQVVAPLAEQGYTLTIASSRSNRSLMEFVHDMGLEAIISYVLGADNVIHAKPHPEPVLMTLRKYGCKPEEAIVVGDTKYDIEMGRNAGVKTCGVTYGNGTRQELEDAGADYLIDDFNSLIHIL